MTEPSDRFDEWLNGRPVEPLAPPPGQYDRIVRAARRRRWGRAAGTGLAVLLVVAGAAGLAGVLRSPAGPENQPVATGPSPTPQVTAVTPSPSTQPSLSPTPTATPTHPPTSTSPTGSTRCHSADLGVTVRPGDSSAGHIGLSIVFTNVSTHTCDMYGYPGVSFLTAPGGSEVNDPAKRSSSEGPATLVQLAPGAKAHADLLLVDTGNFAPASCKPVTTTAIRVYPPDETQDIVVASSQLICSVQGTGLAQVYPVRTGG